MSILLQPLKCAGCGAPLKSKERDHMLLCDHCGRLSLFAGGKMCPVDFSIIKPARESTSPLVYVPFWVVNADVQVRRECISGGGIRRMIKGEEKMRGVRDFYICAADSIPESSSRVWNMDLTITQPELIPQPEFKNGGRIVMTMDEETAGNNAEFIFLRYETELSGTLQELAYSFVVNHTKVLYLPAYKEGNNYQLGI